MKKIALTMISKGKGEEQSLSRALASIAPFVHGIFITLTMPKEETEEAIKVIKTFERPDCPVFISYGDFRCTVDKEMVDWLKGFLKYDPQVKIGDRLFEFDKARNFNLEQVSKEEYPWIVWIDTDDVFRRGEKLQGLIELAERAGVEALYFNYIYQAEFDSKGEIKYRIIEHVRERLLRNNGDFKWIAPIHETLIEQKPTRKTDVPDCDVVHMATMESRLESLTRNLKNLELAIYRTKGEDPRHTYYLAKAYFDLNTPDTNEKIIPLIYEYEEGEHKSGWPQERQQAWEYLCEVYRRKGDHRKALEACLRVFTEPCEPFSSAFLNLSLCWVMLQNWELAMYWVKVASIVPEQKTSTLVRNTKDLQGRMLEVIYNASLNLHEIDKAWAAAVKMFEMWPEEESVKKAYEFISNLRTQRDLVLDMDRIAAHLRQTGEQPKIKALLSAAPRIIEQTPYIQQMYLKNNPPTPWGENEIAIFCGPGFTEWSPKKLDNPQDSFVGGSEEAVIHLSRELAKLNYKVTVYGSPGADEGEIDGVRWLPYYKFNTLDNFNILIVWRQIGFFDTPIKAKKTYLWLHDIPNKLEYTPERVGRITKIIPLSKWHREQLDNVPDDKIMISTNGI